MLTLLSALIASATLAGASPTAGLDQTAALLASLGQPASSQMVVAFAHGRWADRRSSNARGVDNSNNRGDDSNDRDIESGDEDVDNQDSDRDLRNDQFGNRIFNNNGRPCGPNQDRGRHLGHPNRHDMGRHLGCLGTTNRNHNPYNPYGNYQTVRSGIVISTNLNAGQFTMLSGLQTITVEIGSRTTVQSAGGQVDLFSIHPTQHVTVYGYISGGVLVADLIRI